MLNKLPGWEKDSPSFSSINYKRQLIFCPFQAASQWLGSAVNHSLLAEQMICFLWFTFYCHFSWLPFLDWSRKFSCLQASLTTGNALTDDTDFTSFHLVQFNWCSSRCFSWLTNTSNVSTVQLNLQVCQVLNCNTCSFLSLKNFHQEEMFFIFCMLNHSRHTHTHTLHHQH